MHNHCPFYIWIEQWSCNFLIFQIFCYHIDTECYLVYLIANYILILTTRSFDPYIPVSISQHSRSPWSLPIIDYYSSLWVLQSISLDCYNCCPHSHITFSRFHLNSLIDKLQLLASRYPLSIDWLSDSILKSLPNYPNFVHPTHFHSILISHYLSLTIS